MINMLLFVIASFGAISVVTNILTRARWYVGYQMALNGIIVSFLYYEISGMVLSVYQIILLQFFINSITLTINSIYLDIDMSRRDGDINGR